MNAALIPLSTDSRTCFTDITRQVARIVEDAGLTDGACVVYCPHTTAGITINENADPTVVRDMLKILNKVIPFEAGYAHAEGNSAAPIKATLTGSSVTIPVSAGRLDLGTWQGIYFCEYDGPRSRTVRVRLLAGFP